jgi:galactose mutarotase-like enzyme
MVKNTNYDDYYLAFNISERLYRWKLQDGLISSTSELLPVSNNRLYLNKALFYEDAIVIKSMHSDKITLSSDEHHHGIHFRFDNFPFFGIWAARDAPFVCLEPWCGIADSVVHNQQLIYKEGIHTLASGKDWNRTWTVECF